MVVVTAIMLTRFVCPSYFTGSSSIYLIANRMQSTVQHVLRNKPGFVHVIVSTHSSIDVPKSGVRAACGLRAAAGVPVRSGEAHGAE